MNIVSFGFSAIKVLPEALCPPDTLKWALSIHECLEKPETQEASRRPEVEFCKKSINRSYLDSN